MEFKNPCATVDLIVEKDNKILLIKRKRGPFKDMWALPGGFLNYGEETLEETAVRELKEETSIIVIIEDLGLLGVYSVPDRDPRGHVISHVYVVKKFIGVLKADDDAKDARFFPLENLPKLAFDHNGILRDYQTQKTIERRSN